MRGAADADGIGQPYAATDFVVTGVAAGGSEHDEPVDGHVVGYATLALVAGVVWILRPLARAARARRRSSPH